MDLQNPSHLLQSGSHGGGSHATRYRFGTRSRLAIWHTTTIVADPKLEMSIRNFHCHPHLRCLCMTEDVCKGFLDNPQHRALLLVRQSIDFVGNLEAGPQRSA